MARIDYADPEDLPAEKRHLLDSLSDHEGGDHGLRSDRLNVYRLLGRNPAVLEEFREYFGTVWGEAGLDAHEREVVILTTARAADSRYEWHQHVRVALDEGMAPETVLAIARDEPDHLSAAHAALREYVEAFVDGDVGDATHDRLADYYDAPTILGIATLAGNYLGLAHVLDALDVDLEAAFVGWDLEEL
jgi:alkylhydroperoxidase family enzyme